MFNLDVWQKLVSIDGKKKKVNLFEYTRLPATCRGSGIIQTSFMKLESVAFQMKPDPFWNYNFVLLLFFQLFQKFPKIILHD